MFFATMESVMAIVRIFRGTIKSVLYNLQTIFIYLRTDGKNKGITNIMVYGTDNFWIKYFLPFLSRNGFTVKNGICLLNRFNNVENILYILIRDRWIATGIVCFTIP